MQTKCTKLGKCLFLSPEVTLGRPEAAADARHTLYLAVRNIVIELHVRWGGCGGIVDAFPSPPSEVPYTRVQFSCSINMLTRTQLPKLFM